MRFQKPKPELRAITIAGDGFFTEDTAGQRQPLRFTEAGEPDLSGFQPLRPMRLKPGQSFDDLEFDC